MRPFTHTIELDAVPVSAGKSLQLFLPYDIEAGMQDWSLDRRTFTTTGEEMNIVIESRFWATSQDMAQRIRSAMVQPQLIKISDTEYELARNGQLFEQVVPFNAIKLNVLVSLPAGSEVLRR
jgi:hypothetical protein